MAPTAGTGIVNDMRARRDAMVADLAELVEVESPSANPVALARCAEVVGAMGERWLGVAPDVVSAGDRPFLHWRLGRGPTRVLLVGHLDTVWPLGTLARWPFEVKDGIATGPGTFDMKSGLVMAFHALGGLIASTSAAASSGVEGVAVVINADEEIGSLGSRALIEQAARGARAALVLEPSAAGALKIARKGVSMYDLDVVGRAAHAGLEPEKGVNATIELAHQVLALEAIADAARGTTVTPTVVASGSAPNTVPAAGTVHIDVRASTIAEQERVDRALRALEPSVSGSTLVLRGGPNRPPFEETSSSALFELATRTAADLGLPAPRGVTVGGGSDGNFTAGAGVPTLDGLGAAGDHAHAEGEYVDVDSLPERAALLAGLVTALLG